MAAVNSLLLLLSTLAPYTEPPESTVTYSTPPEYSTVTYSTPPDWSNDILSLHVESGDEDLSPCYPDYEPGPISDCPPREHYERCGSLCEKTCFEFPCPVKCCLEGCFCDEGYMRTLNGTCVTKEECSSSSKSSQLHQEKKCRPDETWADYLYCDWNCYTYGIVDHCPIVRHPGCFCRPPTIRGCDGKCILPPECPHYSHFDEDSQSNQDKKCGPNERWADYRACDWNCYTYGKLLRCPTIKNPGCACIPPWIRGCDGKCILPPECPNVGPFKKKNPPECENPDECFGKDFSEDSTPTTQEKPDDCTEKEYYSTCGTACEENCTSYTRLDKTCNDKRCVVGCFCQPGYIRGHDGQCVWPIECSFQALKQIDDDDDDTGGDEFICPTNEEYNTCGTSCQRTCSNYDDPISCSDVCAEGCFCKEPFVRDPEGKCVQIGECPAQSMVSETSLCPEYEEWKFCGTACPKNCTNYDKDVPCVQLCKMGCFCEASRVRGPDGRCVLIEECPPISSEEPLFSENEDCEECEATCPENEEYQECGTRCPKNCANYDKEINCPAVCQKGCFCKEPMVRGPAGNCIGIEECPETPGERRNRGISAGGWNFPNVFSCKENEELTPCRQLCPDTCNNHKLKGRFCKYICMPGCTCKEGYVIGREGLCVKKELCEEERPENCEENEYYEECGSYCETDCFNYNMKTRECEIKTCKKGCSCKRGWVRSPDMKCILPDKCQSSAPSWGKMLGARSKNELHF